MRAGRNSLFCRGNLRLAATVLLAGTFSFSAWAGDTEEVAGGRPAESRGGGCLPVRIPYRAIGDKPAEFNGPDRLQPAPDVGEVKIGLFCPSNGDGASIQRGAQMAVQEANRQGGYHGKPFTIAFRRDDGLWGSGAGQMVRLVYGDSVWAVLGSSTGPATHVAEQIANRARVVLMTPTATDASLTQANVPWIFRCAPDDKSQAEALARYLFLEQGYVHVAAVSPATHDGAYGVAQFEAAASRTGHPLALSLRYRSGETDFGQQLALLGSARVEAVVVWAPPLETASFIRQMRVRGMNQPVVGNSSVAGPAFVEAAGVQSEGVVVPLPYDFDADTATADAFRQAFRGQYGDEPDMHAAYAYDGMRLIVEAVGTAGLNRARIRDAIAAREGFLGATGRITFDGTGANTAPVLLAKIVEGRFQGL